MAAPRDKGLLSYVELSETVILKHKPTMVSELR